MLFDSPGVWYQVDGNLSSCFDASTVESSFNTTLAVYKGDCRTLATCIAAGRSQIRWTSDGTLQSYKVLVVGQDGDMGPFTLNITVRLLRAPLLSRMSDLTHVFGPYHSILTGLLIAS